MKRVEFTHVDDRYRIELDDELLTMATWADGHWREVARLTMSAADVLADLDGLLDIGHRPTRPLSLVPDRGDGDDATNRTDW